MVAARVLPPPLVLGRIVFSFGLALGLALGLGGLAACAAKPDVTRARGAGNGAVEDKRDLGRSAAGIEAGVTEPGDADAGPRFGFTLARWMKAHGVAAPPDIDVCDYEATIGDPAVPLVVCSTHTDLSDERVVYRRAIFAAEHGELRCVFDAAIASGRRDPPADLDGGADQHAVRLEFSMTADGTITLRDSGDRGCSAAAAAKRRDEAVDKVCAGRGVYVWKEGRFARAARAPSRP
jgi:hypothetical protein